MQLYKRNIYNISVYINYHNMKITFVIINYTKPKKLYIF